MEEKYKQLQRECFDIEERVKGLDKMFDFLDAHILQQESRLQNIHTMLCNGREELITDLNQHSNKPSSLRFETKKLQLINRCECQLQEILQHEVNAMSRRIPLPSETFTEINGIEDVRNALHRVLHSSLSEATALAQRTKEEKSALAAKMQENAALQEYLDILDATNYNYF